MTDITDKDRRNARAWAKGIVGGSTETIAAARVILATVEPPAPTLAEELRDTVRWWREEAPTWGLCHARFESFARRAEQIEEDRDEARAEVERLTAKNEELIRTDNYREFREFLGVATVPQEENVAPDQQSNTQETLAGSFKSSLKEPAQNPADVPPGEAWIVEFSGERCTAVKDNNYFEPWSAVTPDGTSVSLADDEVTLVSRLVPAPRVITDPEELDGLEDETVLRGENGFIYQRDNDHWITPGSLRYLDTEFVAARLPVTVLWEAGE